MLDKFELFMYDGYTRLIDCLLSWEFWISLVLLFICIHIVFVLIFKLAGPALSNYTEKVKHTLYWVNQILAILILLLYIVFS